MVLLKRFLVLIIGFGFGGQNLLLANHENPEKVKKSLLSVQTQIQKIEKKIYSGKKEERKLNEQLSILDKQIGESAETLAQLQIKTSSHAHMIHQLQTEEKQLQHANAAQERALAELLEGTFQQYRKKKIQLLLEQKAWSQLARVNQYYQFFYMARAKEIDILQKNITKVKNLKEKIHSEEQEILSLKAQTKTNQDLLIDAKLKRQDLLTTLSGTLHSVTEELLALQKQEQHLRQVFKTLQKNLATTPTYIAPVENFLKMKHQLLLPVQAPGIKLSLLSQVTTKNSRKSYIPAPTGSAVNAIFSGKVVFAEWLRGLGLLIIIDHGNGYMSLYGNNQKLYKNIGDFVNQGEMVARVGQSGGHAEPGLYFEIRKDGEAIDPTPWFQST